MQRLVVISLAVALASFAPSARAWELTAADQVDACSLIQESVNLKSLAAEKAATQDPENALTLALESEDAIDGALENTENLLVSMLETGSQSGKSGNMLVQLAIPTIAVLIGLVAIFVGGRVSSLASLVGKICVFFGTQTFMNLYMKMILSAGTISEEKNYHGFPAAFAISGIQQVTSLAALLVVMGFSQATPWPYRPKQLRTKKEFVLMLIFAFTFMINIALNNCALALLPLSVNLIIRTCSPLLTATMQIMLSRLKVCQAKEITALEITLMLIGICCAVLCTVSKARGGNGSDLDVDRQISDLILGVILCVSSLLAGAINWVLAETLGDMSLNPLDTVLYMALPVFVLLIIPVFCIPHPVWGGTWTDWQIVKEVVALSPGALGLAFLSGIFALIFNLVQYTLVQSLSATYAAFCGNFNKAATIFLAVLVKLEVFPSGPWGKVMLASIIGNILSFSAYSYVQSRKTRPKETKAGK